MLISMTVAALDAPHYHLGNESSQLTRLSLPYELTDAEPTKPDQPEPQTTAG